MTAPLILASASPRRRVDFVVEASTVPEVPYPAEAAAAFAQRAAREKAVEVASRHARRFVLGADTVVALGTTIFGKPADRNQARAMLAALSGRTHVVITGVALVDPAAAIEEIVVESQVEFRALLAAEIETYLDSGEPFDKAGAYAVQGLGGQFVVAVRGSRSNVIGLPMEATMALLKRRGLAAR